MSDSPAAFSDRIRRLEEEVGAALFVRTTRNVELSEAGRRLLTRSYFRGLTAREISEADGIPLGTVKTRLRTAMIKVRRANEGKEIQ